MLEKVDNRTVVKKLKAKSTKLFAFAEALDKASIKYKIMEECCCRVHIATEEAKVIAKIREDDSGLERLSAAHCFNKSPQERKDHVEYYDREYRLY